MSRYKEPSMQALFVDLLRMAEDKSSELYQDGQQRRGAAHRCAFWDGFNGLPRSPLAEPRTMGWACFMAGKQFAAKSKRATSTTGDSNA